jgi:hypothetical protein
MPTAASPDMCRSGGSGTTVRLPVPRSVGGTTIADDAAPSVVVEAVGKPGTPCSRDDMND